MNDPVTAALLAWAEARALALEAESAALRELLAALRPPAPAGGNGKGKARARLRHATVPTLGRRAAAAPPPPGPGEEAPPCLLPLARVVRRCGPSTTAELARACGEPPGRVAAWLENSPWFEREQDGWHLTSAGFSAADDRGDS